MIIFQPDRYLLRKFIATHAPTFSGSILDTGGGKGRYRHLFTSVKEYRILDIDPSVQPDITGSIEHIPLQDSSLDGIICTQVLGDVWNIVKAIQEMCRILKPGGKLLITESLLNEEHDEPCDYWRCTQFSWKKLLEQHFFVETIEPRGGFYSHMAQDRIRFMIERYSLYKRPLLGRLTHMYALIVGKYALLRDQWDTSAANKKFPIGYCILARKK